jgi:hypothetical protein
MESIDGNGCRIRKEDQNLVFAYSPAKLDLTQSQNQDMPELLAPGEFAAIAEEFSEVVVRTLEVTSFPRIGFRVWTLYSTASVDEASEHIGRMSFFSPCKALTDLGQLSHASHGVVIARPNHMIRVAATPFEQQVRLPPSVLAAARTKAREHWKDQKKVLIQSMKARKAIKTFPAVGIMIDLDAYIEEVPYPEQVSARTFIVEATKDFEVIREAILLEEDHS